MLGLVIVTSFLGQLLLNRAFQISNASKASSINCLQVRGSPPPATCEVSWSLLNLAAILDYKAVVHSLSRALKKQCFA